MLSTINRAKPSGRTDSGLLPKHRKIQLHRPQGPVAERCTVPKRPDAVTGDHQAVQEAAKIPRERNRNFSGLEKLTARVGQAWPRSSNKKLLVNDSQ